MNYIHMCVYYIISRKQDFRPCKLLKTIQHQRKYQSKHKSAQDTYVQKPWKG